MGRGIRQSAAVFKIGVLHSQAFGPLVHHLNECGLVSPYVFSHRYACIISRRNDNTFNERLHCLNLALLQKNLGTSHGFCMGAGYDFVIQVYLP